MYVHETIRWWSFFSGIIDCSYRPVRISYFSIDFYYFLLLYSFISRTPITSFEVLSLGALMTYLWDDCSVRLAVVSSSHLQWMASLSVIVDVRHMMITQKAPGVMAGVQHEENGEIEWRQELPDMCLLSKWVLHHNLSPTSVQSQLNPRRDSKVLEFSSSQVVNSWKVGETTLWIA